MVKESTIKSVLQRQLQLDMGDFIVRIERIGKHGSAVFYLWTSIQPSEGIHPTVDSMPLTKQEVLTRVELLCDYRGKVLSDIEIFAMDQVFLTKIP
jgi:hypothetical protein